MQTHSHLGHALRCQIYALKKKKPYAAWQRGLNENSNGLVRGYYPKDTNFAMVNIKEIRRVVKAINSRPRKTLNYTKPLELV